MSSLAIYDAAARKLFIATDRSGFFPVFFAETEGKLVFSSSIKGVRAAVPGRGMDGAALTQHLLFDAQYGSSTFYEGISNLHHGGYLEMDTATGRLTDGRYFTYESLFDISEYRAASDIDAASALDRLLGESCGRILEGRDREGFGVLCGGGIDCSLVASVLKRVGAPMPMFCAWISDVKVREADQAGDVAEALGTELVSSYMPREKYYPFLLRNMADLDQPVVHPNLARIHVIAASAREQGRRSQILGVASDLLFGGTGNVRSMYRYQRLRGAAALLPRRARALAEALVKKDRKLDIELRMRNRLSSVAAMGFGDFDRARTQRGLEEAVAAIRDPKEAAVKALMLENLCDYQQHLLNIRYELTAGEGISYYFPFLDREVVRFAVNLPVRHCVSWSSQKILVRKALAEVLGSSIASRPKWGGDIPLEKWVVPLKFLLRGGFLSEELGFDHEALLPVAERDVKLLWNLMDTELWGRISIWRQAPPEILGLIRAAGIDCAGWDDID
jgi:asparagine synthase (glutamine-hydrolysing)